MHYTGVGARNTPKKILKLMKKIGYYMVSKNVILRSGGAEGADTAFQKGCEKWCKENNVKFKDRQCIIIPWNNFNNHTVNVDKGITTDNHWLSYDITIDTHPNDKNLKDAHMKLMQRNVTQVYGYEPHDQSGLLICWTPDGAVEKTTQISGGTGQAIRLAINGDVEVFNLKNKKHINRIKELIT